jgi:hypothetical protein
VTAAWQAPRNHALEDLRVWRPFDLEKTGRALLQPARALGVNERAVRFWERKHDRRPTSAPNDARIEQALLACGVVLFAEPTLGARLAEMR